MNSEPFPYQATSDILNRLASLAEHVGKLEGMNLLKPSPKLRRKNRIQTVQSSLAIEGNRLSLDQVTALRDGKRVVAPRRDILEAENAFKVYGDLSEYSPFSLDALLAAHGALMQGLLPEPGAFRRKAIGILRGNDIFHQAPHAREVAPLMEGLFSYLAESRDHLLIKSCRFHYQLEFIHPFPDGNGRMGRLWQTRILMTYHPIFEYLPVEHLIIEHQDEYYKRLAESDRAEDCTTFIEFLLAQIDDALKILMAETRSVTVTAADRLAQFKKRFPGDTFSRKDYQNVVKSISTATASRDLSYGFETGLLERIGDKRTAVYRFMK
jgi:Fic family protein